MLLLVYLKQPIVNSGPVFLDKTNIITQLFIVVRIKKTQTQMCIVVSVVSTTFPTRDCSTPRPVLFTISRLGEVSTIQYSTLPILLLEIEALFANKAVILNKNIFNL